MTRFAWFLTCTLLSLVFLNSAGGQSAKLGKTAQLRVLVPHPHADATLLIDGHLTKQTGLDRLYVTPDLDVGRTFTYTVTVKWRLNSYTEAIRTRTATVEAGKTSILDMNDADDKNPDKFVIGQKPNELVTEMCKLANVGKDDIVYDLGCGDGRVVIAAVKDFNAKRGIGVDKDPDCIAESKKAAKAVKVEDRVTFRQQDDVLTIKDFGAASVVMLYTGADVNKKLMPILKNTLKPGARIVSLDSTMGDWKAEKTVAVKDDDGETHKLYLWKIGR